MGGALNVGMSRFEQLDAKSWAEFVGAPVSVLMLGKTDCAACAEWAEELTQFLASDETYPNVRFGKLVIDTPGLVDFKRASPWLAEVDVLPFTVIYKDGQKTKSFAGKGIERLSNRLNGVLEQP